MSWVKFIKLVITVTSRMGLASAFALFFVACGGGSGGASVTDPEETIPVLKLPHTGITSGSCYQAGSSGAAFVACNSDSALNLSGVGKQDGMYADIKPFSYTKIGFDGKTLGDVATNWCAVKDNVTGFVWQNHQSTPIPYTNLGNNSAGDASQYVKDNAVLCGMSGWRLPSIDELETLINLGASRSTYFQNSSHNYWYWSATPHASIAAQSWSVEIGIGPVFPHPNSDNRSRTVRLIQANQSVGAKSCPTWITKNRFTFSADGKEVTDKRTGLVWGRCSVGQTWNGASCVSSGSSSTFTHEAALLAAKEQTGWRLPNRRELFSLVDKGCGALAIDSVAFPNTQTNSYWASTPYGMNNESAWVVDFEVGFIGNEPRTKSLPIRLVRVTR